jgi:ABC-type nitrate/sulfonate/bicarbonate transport system substrate-binding protein
MKRSGPLKQPTKKFASLWLAFLLACLMSSDARAADNIVIGMAGLNFSFLPFPVAVEKRFYEKYDLSVKPVLMRAQSAIPALIQEISTTTLTLAHWFVARSVGCR